MNKLEELVEKIKKDSIPTYFISPHLDDAAFSAGELLLDLAPHTDVTIATVFTEGSAPPNTRFANKFMRLCGFDNVKTFYEERKKEDKKIFDAYNIKTVHLNFIDAAWRKKEQKKQFSHLLSTFIPEIIHIYPFQWDIRKTEISIHDAELIDMIKKSLEKIVPENNSIVFIPSAIGNHIDHIIVRSICEQIFTEKVYWADYPYNTFSEIDKRFVTKHNLQEYSIKTKFKMEKRKLVESYETQINAIFPQGNIPELPEKYYMATVE